MYFLLNNLISTKNLLIFICTILIIFFFICLLYENTKNNLIIYCIFISIYILFFFFLTIFYKNFFIFAFKKIYFDFIKFNIFSLVLIIISLYVSYLSYILALNKNSSNNIVNFVMYLIFNLSLFFFVFSKNLIIFLLSYEFLLVSSASLIFFGGQNKRSLDTTKYFLIWTQTGSFFVFVAILYLFFHCGISSLDVIPVFTISELNKKVVSLLLFVGFGIKIPVWPFHLWLTKTHVEASTSFSIFLSGILVKTALFGLYKFYHFISDININIFLFFILFSILDISLKFFCQSDLKKMIAMATIFEMNMILLNFLFFFELNIKILIIFLFFHSVMSAFLFQVVDIIYTSCGSRLVQNIQCVSNYNYTFLFLYLIGIFIFLGMPLTVKFYLEFFFFLGLFLLNPIFLFFFIIVNTIFILFFSNCFIYLLFGSKSFNNSVYIISKKNIAIVLQLVLFLIFFSFVY